MKRKLKVQALINGAQQEVEIELDTENPPAGFLAEDYHNTVLEKESKRNFDRGKRGARLELLKDDDFQTEALAQWEIDPKKAGSGKPSNEEIVRLQEAWRQTELKPIQDELTASKGTHQTLLDTVLSREITAEAARLGLLDSLTEAPDADTQPAIVAMLKHRLSWDPETKTHAVKKGSGFEYSPKATQTRPYKGVADLLQEFVADERNKHFLKNTRQQVPGVSDGDGKSRAPGTASKADFALGHVDLEKVAKGEVKVI